MQIHRVRVDFSFRFRLLTTLCASKKIFAQDGAKTGRDGRNRSKNGESVQTDSRCAMARSIQFGRRDVRSIALRVRKFAARG
jgi:hypothetical protein